MANLNAIVRATRACASARATVARHQRQIDEYKREADGHRANHGDCLAARTCERYIAHHARLMGAAMTRFNTAQAVLGANPLPGDPS